MTREERQLGRARQYQYTQRSPWQHNGTQKLYTAAQQSNSISHIRAQNEARNIKKRAIVLYNDSLMSDV